MITNNTSNPRVNFTSTLVPYSNKSFSKIVDSVSDYFQLRGYGNLNAKGIRDKINLGQAGIGLTDEGLLFVGKDREADVFISKQLAKVEPDAKYVQDTPKTVFKEPIIDLEKLSKDINLDLNA